MNFNITIRKTSVSIEHETINAASQEAAQQLAEERFQSEEIDGMGKAFYAEITNVELDEDEE